MLEITTPTVTVTKIGHEAIDLILDGMTDQEVLEAAAEKFPHGLNLAGSNLGPVWVHPEQVLNLGHADGFGLEFTGLAHSAAELVRLAADPERAVALGGAGVDRMIALLCSQAAAQAKAKRPNQLHAHRWGASAKVVLADRVAPGTVEIHPTGNLANRLAKLFRCAPGADGEGWADLEGQSLVVMRHPFILGYVVKIAFNEDLTKNLVLANRLDFRKSTQGDADGDQAFLFPVRDEALADRLAADIQAIVPDYDVTDYALGTACHEDPTNWGEVVEKSTDDKLAQEFTKSIGDWIHSHIKLGDYANRLTPFSYRISDIGAAMAAVGIPGGQAMGIIGAVLEESFYIGLTGGPEALDAAMDLWFNQKMSKSNQQQMFAGMAEVLSHDLIYNEVIRTAIARGSSINRMRFDSYDPQELMVHLLFQVGKGRISLLEPERLQTLAAIWGDGNLDPALRDSFAGKMLFHAARKLSQVVGKGKPLPSFKQEDDQDDQEGQDWTTSFEED